jgi:hypothetical protein
MLLVKPPLGPIPSPASTIFLSSEDGIFLNIRI